MHAITRYRLWVVLVAAVGTPTIAHAQHAGGDPVLSMTRPIPVEKLATIRGVGRSILAAKWSAVDDPADTAAVGAFRAGVDEWVAAEWVPTTAGQVTIQVPAGMPADTAASPGGVAPAPDFTRPRLAVGQLRQRAAALRAAAGFANGNTAVTSAGLPVGMQRARLFERWADEIDAALALDSDGRARALRDLQSRLAGTVSTLSAGPIEHDTPTLRAMPAPDETLNQRTAGDGQP